MTRTPIPLDPSDCQALVTSSRWQKRVSIADDGCWIMAGTGPRGYIQIRLAGRLVKSTRVALVATLGRDLLPGTTAGHLCHDSALAAGLCAATDTAPCLHRRCVNPAHLVEQTQRENNLSGGNKGATNAARTTCPRGHSIVFGDPDAYLTPGSWERDRECHICALEKYRARNAARAAAHRGLGLSQTEYVSLFGSSQKTAEAILVSLVAGVPAYQLIHERSE